MASESEQIVEHLTAQFKKLFSENFTEFWAYRDGDNDVKANFAAVIGCEGRQYTLSLTMNYGIRVKRQESEIFNPTQLSLNLDDGARPTEKITLR